jgi:hypothetical protein
VRLTPATHPGLEFAAGDHANGRDVLFTLD